MTESRIASPVAVVTGASSGIGAATARALAADGFHVVTGARRLDRLESLTGDIGGAAHALDVTDPASVAAFAAALGDSPVHLLVNNAGGAHGMDSIENALDERWEVMFETNVLGVMRMTRALLPALRASGDGHVVNVGSTAGFETYPGGGGYTASKHALKALTRTLRRELLGEPIRVTEVAPGLAETEFSNVRFQGDDERADAVYRGMTPLTAEDVAECIRWVASLPSHVNVDELVVRPRDQATSNLVHREES
jgi:NADP-dependent 3-hydroxy acid dehydrogenase YdfG